MTEKEHGAQLTAYFTRESFELDFQPTREHCPETRRLFEQRLYERYRENPDRMLYALGFDPGSERLSPSMAFLQGVARRFALSLSRNPDLELIREKAALTASPDDMAALLRIVPFALGVQWITEDWIRGVWSRLSRVFVSEIGTYLGSVADYLRERDSQLNAVGRVFFHLVENRSEEFPFAFLATYSTGSPGERKATHVPLKNALLEYDGEQDKLLALLSTVSRAAEESQFISGLVESGELFSPLRFASGEAHTFLREVPLYEQCGILCRIPDWWKRRAHSVRLSVTVGEKPPSRMGMDALLSFDAALYLGDDVISPEEVRALLSQTGGLSLIKGKWVEVDADRLQAALDAYEKARKWAEHGDLTLADSIRMQLGTEGLLGLDTGNVPTEISHGDWLRSAYARMTNPELIENTVVGGDFRAQLRPYQQKGLDWLRTLRRMGLGACLADDMGLGKTVQILALLEYIRSHEAGKALLVIPASLIGNWRKEIERFAPRLRYRIVHGKDQSEIGEETDADVTITTYGMAARLEWLESVRWDLIILDEAQAIKNPATKQTRAVKRLRSGFRVAMTGTPIENSLSDLWSLFDFLNTGLLGSSREFSRFAKKLAQTEGAQDYARLRAAIQPFILRRLKTDKAIIDDLPDKMEMKDYATLTKKQIVLYKGLVDELENRLGTAEGIDRKGLVLASIMKFKQICNHPDQYLGQAAFEHEHSGKFGVLASVCETIREKRERVLVFTQFREMTEPLADFLETIFGRRGLLLHGGTPVARRAQIIEQFCGAQYVPYIVLSLKAGGVGLNLTAANHVIHFDRWWNPAVENQATDRAFRIGQRKDVMVHKLITTGTIEEKIDKLISEKSKLADELIASSGEGWITQLDNARLMELFTLSGE